MLDNRIPPPLVFLALGAGMYAFGTEGDASPLRLGLVALLVLAAGAFGLPAVAAFRRVGTTIDPVRIDRASSLVTTGIFARSRNPMYAALVLTLCAWAAWLGGWMVWLGPVALVLWLDRFQIRPEERSMATRFGADYDAYRARTRRWL